jgi:hypothetical protein
MSSVRNPLLSCATSVSAVTLMEVNALLHGAEPYSALRQLCSYSATQYFVNPIVHVRFQVFAAVTMKNGVFWDVLTKATRRNIPEDSILPIVHFHVHNSRPYPEPANSSSHRPTLSLSLSLSMIHLNVVHLPTSWCS